jgi:hypothetical protein
MVKLFPKYQNLFWIYTSSCRAILPSPQVRHLGWTLFQFFVVFQYEIWL